MIITITTSSKYREMVLEIMQSLNLLYPIEEISDRGREIVLQFPDDSCYLPIAGWGADALACGLIFGFKREG